MNGANTPLLFLGKDSRQTRSVRFAFYLMLVSIMASIIFVASSLFIGQSVSIGLFVGGLLVQIIAIGFFVYTFYHHREAYTVVAKAIVLNTAGAVLWWGIAQPLLTLLIVNLNPLQLGAAAFVWLWELPVFSILLSGIYIAIVARPLQRIEDPVRRYQYTLRFPVHFFVGVMFIAIISYVAGVAQLRVLAQLPWIEIGKLMMLGVVSGLFMGVFYRFAAGVLMQPLRKEIESTHHISPITRSVYARGVFVLSGISSAGALLFIGVAVLHSFQQITADNVLTVLNEKVGRYIAARSLENQNEATVLLSGRLIISPRARVAIIPAGRPFADELLFSQETVDAINSRVVGSFVDRKYNESAIYFFVDPATQNKVVISVPLADFYLPVLTEMQRYTVVALIILIITLALVTYPSTNLARTFHDLIQAVKRSKDTLKPFTFTPHSADEIDELSLALKYFINQSNELRLNLEEKVKQRTAALLQAEEAKQAAEIESAQKSTQFERQKRELAEQTTQQLEEEVRERTTALRDAIRRLEELDRVKSEFISLASHQIRTPLTSLRWAQHALLEETMGKLTPEQRDIIETTLERTMYMTTLVNELLDVTRIEDRRYELKVTQTSLGKLVHDTADQFVEIAERKGVTLTIHVPKSLPSIAVDVEKLSIAIVNLVDNAVKYTDKGGSVTVTAGKKGESLYVEVRDTGIGIPEKDIYRTFSKFFRASNAIAMHTSGSGLGLYITKTVVEKHGGEVGVQSKVGEGTAFTIYLPIDSPLLDRRGQAHVSSGQAEKLGAIQTLIDKEENNK